MSKVFSIVMLAFAIGLMALSVWPLIVMFATFIAIIYYWLKVERYAIQLWKGRKETL
jgi:hypothetical protein